jgi:hypothetical protein
VPYKFLASPYSHRDRDIRRRRYHDTNRAVAWLWQRRLWTFSPIVHCHHMTEDFGFDTEASAWVDYNTAMMEASNGLFMLRLGGWTDSAGVRAEYNLARSLNLDTHIILPRGDDDYLIELVWPTWEFGEDHWS